MLNTFDPFAFASAAIAFMCVNGSHSLHIVEGNTNWHNHCASNVRCIWYLVDMLLMILALPFLCTTHARFMRIQEFHSSAEEMRHNLLAIYQKLGKSFEVGDIATSFS